MPATAKSSTAQLNLATVTTKFLAFRKVSRAQRTLDVVDLNLPDVSYETEATWIKVPTAARDAVQRQGRCWRSSLHAASHALLNVLPLYILCTPADCGTECDHPADGRMRPSRLLLFDRQAGGNGVSAQVSVLFTELLEAGLELLESCDCDEIEGCPGCTHNLECAEYNIILDKQGAKTVLRECIAAEEKALGGRDEHLAALSAPAPPAIPVQCPAAALSAPAGLGCGGGGGCRLGCCNLSGGWVLPPRKET